MKVEGDYHSTGHAQIRELVPVPVAQAMMMSLHQVLGGGPVATGGAPDDCILLARPGFQFHGNNDRVLTHFLWGMTPAISHAVGRDLLPTCCYFRIHRRDDFCRVHSDRFACQHSVSLTLALSENKSWALDVSTRRDDDIVAVTDDFGGDPFASLPMQVGDAALYQGVSYPHGRLTPNPNAWSAHLFLHFVERDGPYADEAFDKRIEPAPVRLDFA